MKKRMLLRRVPLMKLTDLLTQAQALGLTLRPLNTPDAAGDFQIVRVVANSKEVRPATLFVALQGSSTDGHQYVAQAIEAGALAVVVQKDRNPAFDTFFLQAGIPVLEVEESYKAFALLNSLVYGQPGQALTLVGVTGTNGKTTVTHLVERILMEAGHSTGLIGTLGSRTAKAGDAYASTGHTTPMANDLQARLAEMLQEGLDAVVMEVSSHALEQYRVGGCRFAVAVHTNLTQDHLDYHKTMENYFLAKAKLFQQLESSPEKPAYAVINADDAYGERFFKEVPAGVSAWLYGLETEGTANPLMAAYTGPKVLAKNVAYTITGATYEAVTPKGTATVQLRMAGQFSVYNSLAALAAGLGLGVPLATCVKALEATQGVRGRFEVVAEQPYVIIDYAHTPDGLENILQAARKVLPEGGKLFVVFGCGGDRDATKRPKMGSIADKLADCLVVTSDNPRSEDPQQILADVLTGIQRFEASRMQVQPDRRAAIRLAMDWATAKDVIVVAGKGHEDYQILADRVIHFDDKEEVQQYLVEKKLDTAKR
jgi:UDP-N-acetylmuramoyl-L-alanyl-D-glutamate--2,6-diaminopimelate ligase